MWIALFICCCTFAMAELSAPLNPTWKDGSTATAMWDAVDGANYYKVIVSAYRNERVIGSYETGTAACESTEKKSRKGLTDTSSNNLSGDEEG